MVVLTDAEAAGGNGATWVFLDAAEDEVWRLAASSSVDGVNLDMLDEGLLASCIRCMLLSVPSLAPASETGSSNKDSAVSPARSVESVLGIDSGFVATASATDAGFLGRGALKS